jgi:hypothetical protein
MTVYEYLVFRRPPSFQPWLALLVALFYAALDGGPCSPFILAFFETRHVGTPFHNYGN